MYLSCQDVIINFILRVNATTYQGQDVLPLVYYPIEWSYMNMKKSIKRHLVCATNQDHITIKNTIVEILTPNICSKINQQFGKGYL